MKIRFILSVVAVFVAVSALCFAQTAHKAHSAPKAHTMVAPDDLKWGPLPANIIQGEPPEEFAHQEGLQVAIVQGDPAKPGPYTVRLKVPDGFRIAPHWHPRDENLTVLQGTFGLGVGDKFDPASGHELSTGSYALMPGGVHHFAWSKGETIVQAYGTGPFKIVWLNPQHTQTRKSSK